MSILFLSIVSDLLPIFLVSLVVKSSSILCTFFSTTDGRYLRVTNMFAYVMSLHVCVTSLNINHAEIYLVTNY